ncbi:cysteine-rich motor neuron 1 protein-like [Ctenocephalides felis]|uniref:cysteine-rich motor neuron 1 protein-like n=1 Tax=Ctenocephalides felis TaxID=7515 RepID=UPI000E6E228A|nr:cysteine-rich motor neuron 1 protein-like [Ctenocephalides felis]
MTLLPGEQPQITNITSMSFKVSDGGNTTRCACKPCSNDISHCKAPLKLKLLKSAQNGEPGSCCDQYECALREVCGSGSAENDQEGAVWMKDACTRCTCRNGYSYCEQITDCHSQDIEIPQDEEDSDGGEGPSGCFALGSLKQNGDRWHEGPCTECVCVRGRKKCTTPICKSDCERPTITVPGECCPVCPPSCPEIPNCGEEHDTDLICSQPDLFGCHQCTCRYNRVLEPALPTDEVEHHGPKKDILTEKPDFTTLAITIVVVSSLIGCCVGVYYFCHARRSRGRRIVNNTHAVFDEKLSLFDVKLRPADGQQIYRQLGTNHVDHV